MPAELTEILDNIKKYESEIKLGIIMLASTALPAYYSIKEHLKKDTRIYLILKSIIDPRD
jgi:hypothetical protein